MRRFMLLFLILAVLLPLAGCKNNADTADGQRVLLENMYAASPLATPEKSTVSGNQVLIDGDILYLYSSANVVLYTFDMAGNYLEALSVSPAEDCSPLQVFPYDGGYVQFGRRKSDFNTFVLARTDENGATVAVTDVENVDFLSVLGVMGENIYLFSGSTVLLYEKNLSVQRTFSLSIQASSFRAIPDAQGTEVAYLQDLNGSLYRWDGVGETTVPLLDVRTTGRIGSGIPGTDYEWYIADSDGIFGVDSTDGTETLLCSFGNSSLFYNDIESLYALCDGVFLAYYQDRFTGAAQYLLLKPSAQQIERILLHMAWLSGDGSSFDTMQGIVSLFNASGTGYFVEISNYGKYGFFGTDSPGLKQFQKDLLDGKSYDLYAMDSQRCSAIFSTMEQNASLMDLSSMAEVLLPSFQNAYRTENGIFALPYSIRYYMLACPSSRDSAMSSILAEANAAAESTDAILSSSPFHYDMAETYARSLLQSGTVDFTSADFLSLLQTVKKVSETWSDKYGFFTTRGYATFTELFVSAQTFLDAVQEDRIRYTYFPISEPGMLAAYKLIYDTVPVHVTGLPTADGKSAIKGQAEINLCAPVSGNTTGAEAFLSYYLSDAIQQNALIRDTQFPITAPAFDREMENRYYVYNVMQFDQTTIRAQSRSAAAPKDVSAPNVVVEMTDAEMTALAELFRSAMISTVQDNMVSQILSEELEPYFAGDRTAEATAEIIEKRVGIYLAE